MENKNKGATLNMVTTGKEKSNTEIVFNNLISYMDEKGLTSNTKIDYLKNTICYIEYENNKRKLANIIGFIPSLVCLLGAIGSSYISQNTLVSSFAIGTGAFALVGTGIRLIKRNPYEKVIINVSDIKDKESVYRKVAPFIK